MVALPRRPEASPVGELSRMLAPQSVAVVGASDRPGSLGERMVTEVLRSPATPEIHFVHPTRESIADRPCVPSLNDLAQPVDLVLLGVPDSAVVEEVARAAARGDGGAVVFGSAAGLSADIAAAAGGMPLCGAGCMGFVNVTAGMRAIGYLEPFPLTPGPVALVTHSGSMFSTLLRTRRRLEYSLAVSSGQELVTTTADYLAYALAGDETRVVALVLETLRATDRVMDQLAAAAERDVAVVALTMGGSPTGRALVDAHSGAIAGDDAAWEALFRAYGVHRVQGLDELVDTVEAFAIGRRVHRTGRSLGIATVHDSGAERALVADAADRVGVPFAELSDSTKSRLTEMIEPGLEPGNPLDLWGSGRDTEGQVTAAIETLVADEAVGLVALSVDLVPEFDGDESYWRAAETAARNTDKPVVVLTNLGAAVDQVAASWLRDRGIPVLEGTASGVAALGHLLDHACLRTRAVPAVDAERRDRWRSRLEAPPPIGPTEVLDLLTDYGIATARTVRAHSSEEALAAAETIGWPVTLKTFRPDIGHKSDVGGVAVGLADADALASAYAEMAARLGPEVLLQPVVGPAVEGALGIVRDPLLGPVVVVAAGGTLVEVLRERRVALPPVDALTAAELLDELPLGEVLHGVRGRPPADRGALLEAIVAISQVAAELGDTIDALDVNPVLATATGAIAVDALVVPRSEELRPPPAG